MMRFRKNREIVSGNFVSGCSSGWISAICGLVISVMSAVTADAACTATFPSNDKGTFPKTLKWAAESGKIEIDLSGLPADVTIFRADLVVEPGSRRLTPTAVYPEGEPEKKLAFVKPMSRSLDALDATRNALKAKQPLRLKAESLSGTPIRLEVSYIEGKPKAEKIPVVTSVKVIHRQGQSFIVFQEPVIDALPEFKTGGDVQKFVNTFKENHKDLRFRIWRSEEKITAASIAKARIVGECGFFTGWNGAHYQHETAEKPPLRYSVEDNAEPVPWGTGVYAFNPGKAGNAWYAITVAVNGEEDLDALGSGNTTAEPVKEAVGAGVPVLQRFKEVKGFNSTMGPLVQMFYVRWETWPNTSSQNCPIDYLVAAGIGQLPANATEDQKRKMAVRVEPAPVGLHMHCWGGSLYDGYGWWYNADKGSVLISANEIPYDWWTGYHDATSTAKGWADGHVQPFTTSRMFSFLDWAATQWKDAPECVRGYWRKLDMNRVFTAGTSMGGSGSTMCAVRYANRIAWNVSWVGVHIAEKTPGFAESYRERYGKRDPAITMPDGKTSPWDYYSDVWWMRNHMNDEIGLIIACNGKNDEAIGWPQAVEFVKALQETHRPHMFNWGPGGHGQRTLLEVNIPFDVRLDQTLPAFTRGSLDEDIGTATPVEKTFDGAPSGAINRHLSWETADIVDEPGRWEMTVLLSEKAPRESCTVDLTPRRVQKFKTPAGTTCTYTVKDLTSGKATANMQAKADEYGLVTLPQIPLVKGKNRVIITTK